MEVFHPWVCEYLSHIIETKQPIEKLCKFAIENEADDTIDEEQISILIEDAILCLVGLLPSIYRYKKTVPEYRIKVEAVLSHLEFRIEETNSRIFKRRY